MSKDIKVLNQAMKFTKNIDKKIFVSGTGAKGLNPVINQRVAKC